MITMSNVWDRATEVLRGRAGQLATIGLLTTFLPNLLGAAVTATAPTAGVGVSGSLAFLVAVAGLLGGLAVVATATDPQADTAAAFARAGQRLLPAIGITALIGIAFGVLLLPIVALLAAAGVDMAALRAESADGIGTVARPGLLAAALLYLVVLTGVSVWVSARLSVLRGVIVNERLGIGAIARTWSLTRGLALRIVGIMVLIGIVTAVAFAAVTLVIGLLARLAAGADGVVLATFLSQAGGGIVTTAFAVVVGTFLGQLYVAVAQRGVATVFE